VRQRDFERRDFYEFAVLKKKFRCRQPSKRSWHPCNRNGVSLSEKCHAAKYFPVFGLKAGNRFEGVGNGIPGLQGPVLK
jgi:hypothetical protein